MDVVWSAMPLLLTGAGYTILITVIAVSLGSVIGLFLGLGRLSKKRVVSFLSTCYVDFFRGTPLLVQIFLVYFGGPQVLTVLQDFLMQNLGIPPMIDTHIPPFVAAVISTSLNSGAYVAEIFRAGIQSIERGQMEAARSLGMTHRQAMRYIILPQAFKRIIPPMGNEFIAMLKDTSLLSVIGFEELARRGQLVVSETYRAFEIWMTVAFIYLIMTLLISRLVDYLERRLKTGD